MSKSYLFLSFKTSYLETPFWNTLLPIKISSSSELSVFFFVIWLLCTYNFTILWMFVFAWENVHKKFNKTYKHSMIITLKNTCMFVFLPFYWVKFLEAEVLYSIAPVTLPYIIISKTQKWLICLHLIVMHSNVPYFKIGYFINIYCKIHFVVRWTWKNYIISCFSK